MARLNPMVSMEMDDESILDAAMPIPMPERQRFPYGLRICLTDKEMDKMELDIGDAVVGGMVHLHAMARITSVSQNDTPDGKCGRVELQIEDMCVESEDEENEMEDREEDRGRRSPLHD